MNLAIDFGNTTGKAGLFEGPKLEKIIPNVSLKGLANVESNFQVQHAIISSSGINPKEISSALTVQSLILSHKLALPFTIDYKTPETLGTDRIAAVAGAQLEFPNNNCLAIDLGTCITYDLLVDGHYKGGGISPGLSMRFKALNTFTANLPLVENSARHSLTGDSTITSILSGVINGIAAEIDGIVGKYCDIYGDLKIVMCGGDHIFFENKLKESIFAAPELVLKGLNGILLHNVSKG